MISGCPEIHDQNRLPESIPTGFSSSLQILLQVVRGSSKAPGWGGGLGADSYWNEEKFSCL